MMKPKKFKLIVFCLLTVYTSTATAQQPKADSAVMYLLKSFATGKLDSASLRKADMLLTGASLTDSQITQLETALNSFKKWENKTDMYVVKGRILTSLVNSNVDKAISYGKQQIEQLDNINSQEASGIKSRYLNGLRFPFRNSNRLEDGFQYYTKKLNEYKIKNDSLCITECYFVLGGFHRISGLIDLAIYNMKKSISYIDSSKYLRTWSNNVGVLGFYYLLKGDPDESIRYGKIANIYYFKQKSGYRIPSQRMASAMLMKNQLDSAANFIAFANSDTSDRRQEVNVAVLQTEAQLKIQSGAFEEAESLLQQCYDLIRKNNIPVNAAAGIIAPDYYFAQLRIQQGRLQEAIDFLEKDITRLFNNRTEILRDYRLIAELHTKTGNGIKAAETYAIFLAKQDSLFAEQEKYRSINFEAEQQMNEKELSIANLESQNRIASLSRNFLIGIAALLLLVVAGIYQRFRFKKKANHALEKTLAELKSTQSQLIQSEKMASLGELTAGIAHEIQNPLNFVNNFSEVNKELIDELKEELKAGKAEDAIALADDIKANSEKITFHGKRADSIVKGMLQHSRSGSGQKEATDINNLLDECLRLSFHGMRAKDKSFNAQTSTSFDSNVPLVNLVSQDIGRVFLNLFTNAFYAVTQKKNDALAGSAEENYNPVVSATTQKEGNTVKIIVRDNGNGMTQKTIEKIFQPFFTTKPTGEGTGLGLSMSYDIITKGHGGELKVETKEGEFAQFTIILPV